jgi:hypothetical protein
MSDGAGEALAARFGRWYDFSNKAEEAALRDWCAANGIDAAGP